MTPSLQTLLETALTLTQKRSTLHRELEILRESIAQTDALLEATLAEAIKIPLAPPAPPATPDTPPKSQPTLAPTPTLPATPPPQKPPESSKKEKPEKKPKAPALAEILKKSTDTNVGLRDTKKQDMARQIETLLLENPEGLRVDQIAERTGRSQSNVYVWLTGRAHEYISQLKKVGPGTWAIVK